MLEEYRAIKAMCGLYLVWKNSSQRPVFMYSVFLNKAKFLPQKMGRY
jgi:hypothetical protein